jgi:F-type H+-transporting ATPase subunit gamma
MASSRQLKNKIRTVGNIKQITKAMQMVSATKMRKSQEVALAARPFAKKAFSLLSAIAQLADPKEDKGMFFKEKEGKTCLVVITSDKGLAGSFNSAVLRIAYQWYLENQDAHVVAVGKKGRDFFKRRGVSPAAEFVGFSDIVTLSNVRPLSTWIVEKFEQGAYAKVEVASTRFVSALVQKPEVHQILPLHLQELKAIIENIVPKTGKGELPFVLEPSKEAIGETLVRDLIEVEILHFVFESNAAEHSARMVAMKNATDNAASLQEELGLRLNKERQAAITQELTEIASAKEALSTQ